jgi:signal transduction histidine kinase
MEINHKEPLDEQRFKTDRSLEDERHKTDAVIDRKVDTVEDDADKRTRLNRIAADKKLDLEREKADLRRTEEFSLSENSETNDKALISERERSDEAQGVARHDEDQIRNRERNKKRLIADALLENERKDTDSNLLDERSGTDRAVEKTSTLLSKEKYSHDQTKTALITRDQFLAVVSHDLKNPLTSISMAASLMRRELSKGTGDAEALFRYLEIIERSSTHMDRMISDLLDVERMSNDKLVLNIKTNNVLSLLWS